MQCVEFVDFVELLENVKVDLQCNCECFLSVLHNNFNDFVEFAEVLSFVEFLDFVEFPNFLQHCKLGL